jgi:hypothetical protein
MCVVVTSCQAQSNATSFNVRAAHATHRGCSTQSKERAISWHTWTEQNAPCFGRKRWPDLEDRHWGEAIHAYHSQPPYWGKHPPTQAARETMDPVQWRLLRYSHVVPSTVMNTRSQWLGAIAHEPQALRLALIDTWHDRGRSSGGTLFQY